MRLGHRTSQWRDAADGRRDQCRTQRGHDSDGRLGIAAGTDLERYQQVTDRSLAAVAAGNPTRARRLEEQVVEPVAEELAEKLEDGAQDEQEQAAASVAAQRELGRTQLVAVPIVFTLGLGLLTGCWALLVGYACRLRAVGPRAGSAQPRRLALLEELRRALDQHQLLLHYQPRSPPTPASSWAWRRWSAGSTPSTTWSHPMSTSLWPNAPG